MGQLDKIVAAANRGKKEALARREQLDEEVRRYDRILKAAGVEEQKKAKSGGSKNGKAVSPERLDLIADLFAQLPEGETLTADDVARRAGIAQSTASAGLRLLREQDRVILAGRKPVEPGTRGQGPAVYSRVPTPVGA